MGTCTYLHVSSNDRRRSVVAAGVVFVTSVWVERRLVARTGTTVGLTRLPSATKKNVMKHTVLTTIFPKCTHC